MASNQESQLKLRVVKIWLPDVGWHRALKAKLIGNARDAEDSMRHLSDQAIRRCIFHRSISLRVALSSSSRMLAQRWN
jgi:hypothetical protein